MSHRRAVYAARFLRPPGWTKRLLLREKPRELTGPYENPVRRWVRLREKARQFSEIPPPRKVPIPKPARKKFLEAVEGVPRVAPEVLQRRLEFLLSPAAVEQQLAAPLRPGLTPYYVEFTCWERQMRELRRCYRAQYLQKLAEVTELERAREAELHHRELSERRRRKQAHLQRIGEEMKRRAILADRKRVEAKVNEAVEMARRSKLKRQRLYWFRRMETLSKLIASADNFEAALAAVPAEAFEAGGGARPPASASASTSASSTSRARGGARAGPGPGTGGDTSSAAPSATGVLLSRNVSVPFLLRQLGGAKGYPQQKTRRIPHVDNVQREILESSYDILPEDAERFAPPPANAPTARQRAAQLYGVFSEKEKVALLEQKMEMLRRIRNEGEQGGKPVDANIVRLLDELEAVRLVATKEAERQAAGRAAAKSSRGEDPEGLPPAAAVASRDEEPQGLPAARFGRPIRRSLEAKRGHDSDDEDQDPRGARGGAGAGTGGLGEL